MFLTDTAIRQALPGLKARKLFDAKGLYIEVSPAGGKWWRLKYCFVGKEKRISLGTYPETSLKIAREKAGDARKLIEAGLDPSDNRKEQKAQLVQVQAAAGRVAAGLPAVDSFEHVAREWFETRRNEWAPSYGDKILRRLELDVFPLIGPSATAGIWLAISADGGMSSPP